MANYHTIIVPEDGLPCTEQDCDRLAVMLDEAEQDTDLCPHGFTVSYEAGELYLIAEENGSWDDLPENVLQFIGRLIAADHREYWEFGVAFTASRLIAGSHGGTAFRIQADGSITTRRCMWEDEPDDLLPA